MPNSLTCTKCASSRVVPDAVVEHTQQAGKVVVKVLEHPEALVFRGAHDGSLTARICCACGLVEFYASNLDDLWEAYASRSGSY